MTRTLVQIQELQGPSMQIKSTSPIQFKHHRLQCFGGFYKIRHRDRHTSNGIIKKDILVNQVESPSLILSRDETKTESFLKNGVVVVTHFLCNPALRPIRRRGLTHDFDHGVAST